MSGAPQARPLRGATASDSLVSMGSMPKAQSKPHGIVPCPRSKAIGGQIAESRMGAGVDCTTPLHKDPRYGDRRRDHGFSTRGIHGLGRAIRLHEVIEENGPALRHAAALWKHPPYGFKSFRFGCWMHQSAARCTRPTEPTAALGALTALACLLRGDDTPQSNRRGRADGRVASPEPHGERRATDDLSSASKAASTIKPALGGNADASEPSAPMEQPPGSGPRQALSGPPDTLAACSRGPTSVCCRACSRRADADEQ